MLYSINEHDIFFFYHCVNNYIFILVMHFKNCNSKQHWPILCGSVGKQSPQKYINPVYKRVAQFLWPFISLKESARMPIRCTVYHCGLTCNVYTLPAERTKMISLFLLVFFFSKLFIYIYTTIKKYISSHFFPWSRYKSMT